MPINLMRCCGDKMKNIWVLAKRAKLLRMNAEDAYVSRSQPKKLKSQGPHSRDSQIPRDPAAEIILLDT